MYSISFSPNPLYFWEQKICLHLLNFVHGNLSQWKSGLAVLSKGLCIKYCLAQNKWFRVYSLLFYKAKGSAVSRATIWTWSDGNMHIHVLFWIKVDAIQESIRGLGSRIKIYICDRFMPRWPFGAITWSICQCFLGCDISGWVAEFFDFLNSETINSF